MIIIFNITGAVLGLLFAIFLLRLTRSDILKMRSGNTRVPKKYDETDSDLGPMSGFDHEMKPNIEYDPDGNQK